MTWKQLLRCDIVVVDSQTALIVCLQPQMKQVHLYLCWTDWAHRWFCAARSDLILYLRDHGGARTSQIQAMVIMDIAVRFEDYPMPCSPVP